MSRIKDAVADAFEATYQFLWGNTYAVNALKKMEKNRYQGFIRKFMVAYSSGFVIGFGGMYAAIIGGQLGFYGGSAIGGAIGTLIFPGIGTAIGATIGGIIGQIGCGIAGWKIGAEVFGFLSVNIFKQAARAISAVFHFNQVNPTNPFKYKLSSENAKFIDENVPRTEIAPNESSLSNASVLTALSSNSENTSVADLPKQKSNSEIINENLAKCYSLKKTQVKTNPFLRLIGLKHLFFTPLYTQQERELNNKINDAVRGLHFGNVRNYNKLETENEKEPKMKVNM